MCYLIHADIPVHTGTWYVLHTGIGRLSVSVLSLCGNSRLATVSERQRRRDWPLSAGMPCYCCMGVPCYCCMGVAATPSSSSLGIALTSLAERRSCARACWMFQPPLRSPSVFADCWRRTRLSPFTYPLRFPSPLVCRLLAQNEALSYAHPLRSPSPACLSRLLAQNKARTFHCTTPAPCLSLQAAGTERGSHLSLILSATPAP